MANLLSYHPGYQGVSQGKKKKKSSIKLKKDWMKDRKSEDVQYRFKSWNRLGSAQILTAFHVIKYQVASKMWEAWKIPGGEAPAQSKLKLLTSTTDLKKHSFVFHLGYSRQSEQNCGGTASFSRIDRVKSGSQSFWKGLWSVAVVWKGGQVFVQPRYSCCQ